MSTDHAAQAASILADLSGLPADDPAILREAARIAPRIATTDPATLRAEIIAEYADLARFLGDHATALTGAGRAA